MTTNIDVEIDINFDFDYEILFNDVVNASLDEQNCPYEIQVDLIITNDDAIQEINRENRGIDKSTDVLSFPMNDYKEPGLFDDDDFEDIACFDPDTGELILGDIVLSYDHILSQASEYGHSAEREYAFLIAHSMLHLMGYDHMEDDERLIMEEHQRKIIDLLIDKYPKLKV